MEIKYTISGNPIPLARPRFTDGHVYDSQAKEKKAFQWELLAQQKEFKQNMLEGSICLDVIFYMPIPQSISNKRRITMEGTRHHIKPDLSNLLKFVEDVANGVLFKDDCLIAKIQAAKYYSTDPRTEFTITLL